MAYLAVSHHKYQEGIVKQRFVTWDILAQTRGCIKCGQPKSDRKHKKLRVDRF